MKWGYIMQSMFVNIWKLGISDPAKYELHCFSNSLHSESAVAKILSAYILQMDQFHCMEAKCNVKPPSAKIPNSVFMPTKSHNRVPIGMMPYRYFRGRRALAISVKAEQTNFCSPPITL
jgi:hypothetical protein